jgi:glycosyltransferase involved in cell wall biosynthesis
MKSITPQTQGRVFFFESHPVQYKAPVYQELQRLIPDAFEVIYATDASIRSGNIDQGFGTEVVWDVPLLNGYCNRVLNNERGTPITTPDSLTGKGIFSLLRRERPAAIVLTHFRYRFDQAAYLAALALGIPILIRQETQDEMYSAPRPWPKRVLRSLAYRLLYAPARHAFAFGELNFEHLRRHGLSPARVSYARFSVPDPFAQMTTEVMQSQRNALRKQLGVIDNQIALAFFGKFIPKKSPQLLFQAIPLIPEAIRSRLVLIFVGSGELQDHLRQTAADVLKTYGVAAQFTGFINQSHLPKYYLAADIAVLPSSFEETWGLVVNEALNAGCAVAITRAVGCQREFTGLERVRVVDTGNAAQLSSAVAELAAYPRDFNWCRDFMRQYSSEAAAQGIANGVQRYLRGKTHLALA